jgi:aldose 1-epimerase
MFSIHREKENGFEKVILKDDSTNTYATLLPSCGAILHDFVSYKDGQEFNVIESYTSAEDFKSHAESKGFLGSKLSPFVCRMNEGTYNFDGKNYTIKKFYLGKHALHGLLYDRPFFIVNEMADGHHGSLTLKYEYRAEDPGYPFNYDCLLTWQLEKDNKLEVTTQCINKDEVSIPIQDGWHPYFKLNAPVDELQLAFQSTKMVEFDQELIPTRKLTNYTAFKSLREIGDTFLDNCFALNLDAAQPLCVLRNPAKKIEIEILPGRSYPFLQIYIPPHRKSIAIENISGPPDAFNNGMGFTTLGPGESVSFKTAYKINHLK